MNVERVAGTEVANGEGVGHLGSRVLGLLGRRDGLEQVVGQREAAPGVREQGRGHPAVRLSVRGPGDDCREASDARDPGDVVRRRRGNGDVPPEGELHLAVRGLGGLVVTDRAHRLDGERFCADPARHDVRRRRPRDARVGVELRGGDHGQVLEGNGACLFHRPVEHVGRLLVLAGENHAVQARKAHRPECGEHHHRDGQGDHGLDETHAVVLCGSAPSSAPHAAASLGPDR